MENYLKYKNYYGSVEFNAEDKVLYGKIVGINDLVSYEGISTVDLENSFKESVEDYLETCQEEGKEPDKFYKGLFNVRTSNDVHRELAIIAEKKQMKLNEIVNQAFDLFLENQGKVLH